MNVIYAGADLVRVGQVVEGAQEFHARARGLDGDHIGVHLNNSGHDVVEFRVAHVGVDLGGVLHPVGGQAEGPDGPVQIGLPLAPPERQPFAQRGLVDLDDGDPGPLQVQHFIADGQRQLPAGQGTGLIIADERPVEDRDRAGQHALHRLLGDRLGIADPVHGHGLRAGDIAKQDGGLHAARTIGLHPAEAAEGKPLQLLAKIFHHVVALGLAMHQHIQPRRFLKGHDPVDLAAHGGQVFGGVDLRAAKLPPDGADFRGLRKGADGGGWKGRQIKAFPLNPGPVRIGQLALIPIRADILKPRAHRGVGDPPGLPAAFERPAILCQLRAHRVPVFIQGPRQQIDLAQLLAGEGQPGFKLGVQPGLLPFKVNRHMQQGAGRGQPQPLAEPAMDRFQRIQQRAEIRLPDIAPVNDAEREFPPGPHALHQSGKLGGAAHRVHMQRLHGQGKGQGRIRLAQLAKIARDHHLHAPPPQKMITPADHVAPGMFQIGAQDRFIKLRPLNIARRELLQEFGIKRQDLAQQRGLVEAAAGLAQPQISDRADERGLDRKARGDGLVDLGQQRFRMQREAGCRREFGHDVVIIGVKPLGHLAGQDALRIGIAGALPARHAEITIQRIALGPGRARGDIAQGKTQVQHLIIKGKIAGRDHRQGLLILPMPQAERLATGQQIGARTLAAPVRFKRAL